MNVAVTLLLGTVPILSICRINSAKQDHQLTACFR
jgi:hypothetical protein